MILWVCSATGPAARRPRPRLSPPGCRLKSVHHPKLQASERLEPQNRLADFGLTLYSRPREVGQPQVQVASRGVAWLVRVHGISRAARQNETASGRTASLGIGTRSK